MDLDYLIEKHTRAMGGSEVIESVRSLQIHLHIIESSFEAEAAYYAMRPALMRLDILAHGECLFSEGYDGSRGWERTQGAEHGIFASPQGSAALRQSAENQLYGLHELNRLGYRLALCGREMVDGVEYAVVQTAPPDGHVVWRYINLHTGLIERSRERKALHPDLDPTETTVETIFDDFRELEGGLLRPFYEVQVDLSEGRILQQVYIQKIAINPHLENELFHLP